MTTTTQSTQVSKGTLVTGWVLSAIPILMMLFAGSTKLLKPVAVVEGFAKSGYPESLIVTIGLLELACTIIYAIPRTAVLGAILMTGLLGGAVDANVRLLSPVFIVPVILGIFVWGGLFFRDGRLRALIPVRR